MTIYKCKECGSTDIRMLFWCNPNTMTIEYMFTDKHKECFCSNCKRITPCTCIHNDNVMY